MNFANLNKITRDACEQFSVLTNYKINQISIRKCNEVKEDTWY